MSSNDDPTAGLDPEHIDLQTFEQILEMDDPGDYEFSSSIVFGFLEQAEQTFVKIQDALDQKELEQLSSLGHFLKGSSATLGLFNIKDACEKIQNLGSRKDDKGDALTGADDQVLLKKIEDAFSDVKDEFVIVDKLLRSYFAKHGSD